VTNSSTTAVSGTTEPGARVYVNDAEAVVAGPFFWANVTLSEGNNTLSIRAVDPAGNSNSLSMRVFLDTVPPSLAVDPAEGALTPMAIYPLAGSTEPGASVTVNGVLVTVGPDGRFRTNLSLRLGQNTIHLISCDAAGNTASLDRNITREAEPVPRTPSTPSGQSGPGNLAMAAVAIVLLAVLIPIFLARRRPRAPEDRDDISSGPRPEGREP